MDFDLEASSLSRSGIGLEREASGLQRAAEGENVSGKRTPEIGGVATRIESAEFGVQTPLRRANPGGIANDRGRVHRHDRVACTRLFPDPSENFLLVLYTGESCKYEFCAIPTKGCEAAGLAVPSQVHAEKRSAALR